MTNLNTLFLFASPACLLFGEFFGNTQLLTCPDEQTAVHVSSSPIARVQVKSESNHKSPIPGKNGLKSGLLRVRLGLAPITAQALQRESS